MSLTKLKILTRPSKLAIKQVEEVMSFFSDITYEVKEIKSYGDKHKEISLLNNVRQDFFTKELDEALLKEEGDVAVHSAKDLPFPLPNSLEAITLLKAFDKTDALVSRDRLGIKRLPLGAKIGTSSELRKKQILSLRPDLKVIEIRGSIEERINLVDQGEIDALVIAACALKRLNIEDRITEILPFQTHPLQGNLAVVALSYRADLKVLFDKINVLKEYGKVYLVGAGPGDPDLLTIKADKVLKTADIIYHDDLISNDLLNHYDTEKFYIGKRKGNHSYAQEEINEMIYQDSIKGKRVIRLKCGNPLIFGRGGEELEYLQRRLVIVEVVPGVSTAQGAAASCRIPITMRGSSNKVSMFTGHTADDLSIDNVNNKETLIYFMGASNIKKISKDLVKEGKEPDTSVALIRNTGLPYEKVIITTLKEMQNIDIESPLIIIIGEVVKKYVKQPRILFTGMDPFNCNVSGRMIHYPLIETEPMEVEMDSLNKYDAVVFTSKTAVRAFCKNYNIENQMKIIAIGPYTKKELELYGYKVDYVPKIPDSDVLVKLIKDLNFRNILYPCSNLSHSKLLELSNVEKKIIYKTKTKTQPKLDLSDFSGIVFSSSSTVKAFFDIYNEIPKELVIYVYGKHTEGELLKKGCRDNVQTIQI